MSILSTALQDQLTRFALALIDQEQAHVIVSPQQPADGFWFGGGNMIEDADGTLLVVGRYRNAGDSRTGIAAGERGCELAVLASSDCGLFFEKVLQFSKSDLNVGEQCVLSIEGSSLYQTEHGFELFVSTEKAGVSYPPGLEGYLKPGTGVWTIERLAATTLAGLRDVKPETVVASSDPRFVHVKDPFVYEKSNGDLVLLFCSHPYCWSSSNTGYAIRRAGEQAFDEPVFDFFPRGFTWDVAMTRGTCLLDIPPIGHWADQKLSLMFYDGGECVRNLDEHKTAIARPRGYSCEELGGVGYLEQNDLTGIERLSVDQPLFLSPHGTGCSRYVDVLVASDGLFASWQQAQADGSQPLVMNFLSTQQVQDLLQ